MTNKTVLSEVDLPGLVGVLADLPDHKKKVILAYGNACAATALQSPEIQRLERIAAAAAKVLSMPKDDGYIVLTVHLDELRAAIEVKP